MILTAEPIGAEEAKQIGLINGLVSEDRLIDEAVGFGVRSARFAPAAVTSCLYAVTRGLNTTIDEGLAIEAETFCTDGSYSRPASRAGGFGYNLSDKKQAERHRVGAHLLGGCLV